MPKPVIVAVDYEPAVLGAVERDLRRKYGGQDVTDEEVLSRFFTSKEDVDRMHAAGPARTFETNGNPLLHLVAELSRRSERNSVFIQRPNFSIHLEKRRAP